MATTAELNVRITAEDEFSGPLDRLHKGLGGLSGALSAPMAAIKGIGSALSGIGLAAQGASAIGEGAVGLANAFGFGLAKELEDTRTKMVAFAGSAAAADDILAQVRTEANQTPFAFKELADATAALLPASKAAGVGLMDVIKQAEVLAALNPSEGLTGAAFSLREALSGDFTSIVERFNLPRERLKALKEEGVPALEAVRIAMAEMGVDASLVAGMANTLGGRWSTFNDTLDSIRLNAAQPIFDQLSSSLDVLAGVVGNNQEGFTSLASIVGGSVAEAIKSVTGFIVMVQNISTEHGLSTFEAIITALEIRIGEVFGPTAEAIFHTFVDAIKAISTAIQEVQAFFDSGSAASEILKAVIVGATAAFVAYQVAVTLAATYTAIMEGATIAMTAAQTALNFVLTMNPIGIVVLALVALAAALVYAYETNETFRNAVNGAWDMLKTAVTSAVEWITTSFNTVMEFVKGLPASFMAAATSVGTAIIDGIKNGVSNAMSGLRDMVRNAANDALNAAKAALGVHSPSTEFEIVGRAIGDGMTLGVDRSRPAVSNAVANLVDVPRIATPGNGGPIAASSGMPGAGAAASDDGRPVIIQLDGQVIARTTWSYLKRQNLVGSNLGFA